jgi:hypothetical protein
MTHKVLILDDVDQWRDAVQWSAESADREATFVPVDTVAEAKQALDGHLSEFRYAIIDLDMRTGREQQGEELLRWLEKCNAFRGIAVLVYSSFPERFGGLSPSIRDAVHFEKKTADDDDNDRKIRAFVRGVIRLGA